MKTQEHENHEPLTTATAIGGRKSHLFFNILGPSPQQRDNPPFRATLMQFLHRNRHHTQLSTVSSEEGCSKTRS